MNGIMHNPTWSNFLNLDTFLGSDWPELWSKHRDKRDVTRWFSVDLRDTGDSYLLTAEIPGVDKEQIDLKVDGRHITISYERRDELHSDGVLLRETKYGKFKRSFEMPDIADLNSINATLKNGVLTVSIAKSAQSKVKQIEVKSE